MSVINEIHGQSDLVINDLLQSLNLTVEIIQNIEITNVYTDWFNTIEEIIDELGIEANITNIQDEDKVIISKKEF